MGKLIIHSAFFFITFLNITFAQTSFRFNINNLDLPIDNKGVLADVSISGNQSGGRFDNKIFLFSGGFLYPERVMILSGAMG